MDIRTTQGCLALEGPYVDGLAHDCLKSLPADAPRPTSLPSTYRVTILNEGEAKGLREEQVAGLTVDTQHVYACGLGAAREAGTYFVLVIWAAGQQLRKKLGLPPRHFYISLCADPEDEHRMGGGIDDLLPGQFPQRPTPDLLDHLAYTLHLLGQYENARARSVSLVDALPDSPRGFMRLADAALAMGHHKLAMLSFACAFQRTTEYKVQEYCTKKLSECSGDTEWGCVFLESEDAQLPPTVKSILVTPWSAELRLRLGELGTMPKLCLESRTQLFVPVSSRVLPALYHLPRFFRWLVPYYIAVMSTPRHQEDIAALESAHLGIRRVLTLTEETPLAKSWFARGAISNTYLPIPNYQPPSIEQMDLILRILQDEQNLPLLIHCGGGKGRAGTVAACYLVAYGFNKSHAGQVHPAMSAKEAVTALRSIRPGSIETPQQEAFVTKWCSTLWKRNCILPDAVAEPAPCPLEIEGELSPEDDLFMLVGLPGSGKSWLATALLARNRNGWLRISQDDSGSRAHCEAGIGRARGRVILDRCNTSAVDRKVWLNLASNWAISPVCVFFDYDQDLCLSRAQLRAGHPTLPPGSRVRNAVKHARKVLVRPSLAEGFKAIAIVRSFAAAMELVVRLSPPINLYKFPRTAHILDLGGATDDDIIMSAPTLGAGHVVITEKVDGSNMGFSLSADRSQILVQNRAHYVNPATHEQFKKLGLWLDQHRQDLYRILDRDEHFAQRYILFGEWMYATHSIPYTQLPNHFLAFDLYDRSTDEWVCRSTLSALLRETKIRTVPIIHEGDMPGSQDLKAMIQQQSRFWDGRVEGVYVKVEKSGRVVVRGKVVRGDFIAGNEHWTRGNLRVNGLDLDYLKGDTR